MKIGSYEIYDNQIKAGDKYFQDLIDKKIPVLCSQPQMGKTGTNIYVASLILKYCRENNIVNFKIYHSIFISDNTVKEQTKNDYVSAFEEGYAEYCYRELFENKDRTILNIIHHADLKKIKFDSNTTYFFMSDESHIGINEKGSIKYFDDQLKQNNCNYYKGYCSATPTVYNILNEVFNKEKFTPVILEPSNLYYGISDYQKEKRIKKSFPLLEKNKESGQYFLTDDSMKIVDDFADKINKFGHGFFIIRDTKKIFDNIENVKLILSYLKEKFNIDCDHDSFHSKNGNINDLEKRLKNGVIPNRSELIFIKGTLRLGKRLYKNHIRCVLDTPEKSNPNGASVIQSLLGRCCGNDVNNDPNNEQDDKFNIYCNLKEIDIYIQWWQDIQMGRDPNAITTSGYNKSNINVKTKKYQISAFSSKEDAIKHLMFHSNQEWFKKLDEEYGIDWRSWSLHTSKSSSHDLCQRIMNNVSDSANTLICEVDGPHEKFINSYLELQKQKPEYIEKFLVFIPKEEKITSKQTPSLEHLKSNVISSDALL